MFFIEYMPKIPVSRWTMPPLRASKTPENALREEICQFCTLVEILDKIVEQMREPFSPLRRHTSASHFHLSHSFRHASSSASQHLAS